MKNFFSMNTIVSGYIFEMQFEFLAYQYAHIKRYQVQRTGINHPKSFPVYSLEEVLGAGPQHELLVDLHVQLGPLGLQLATARRRPRVRALKRVHVR